MKPLLFLLIFASAIYLPGQQSSPPVSSTGATTTFRVNTQIVTVDLVATDKGGKPILDLKPEDLKIFEDGKPRPIQSFSPEHADQTKSDTLTRLRALTQNRPENVFTNFDGSIENVPVNGCTILLLDVLNTPPASLPDARTQLIEMLKKYGSSRPIAVYALDSNLHILQNFTSDPTLLTRAVTSYGTRLTALQPTGTVIWKNTDPENDNQVTDARVSRTLSVFAAIARSLQGYGGRKNLIWLSGGFPLDVLPAAFGHYATGQRRYYHEQVLATAHLLATANVVVYPVDARGLQTTMPDSSYKISGIYREWFPAVEKADAMISDPQQSMRNIADQTGGRAFYNTNAIGAAVAAALDDGNNFYSLTFPPQNTQADGALHTIRIETTRPGAHLRYRQGYYALDATQRDELGRKADEMQLHQALFAQRPLSTGLPLMAQIDKNHPDIVDLWIHGPEITVLNEPSDTNKNTPHLQLEITAVTFDSKSNPLTTNSVTLLARLRPESLTAILADGLSRNVKFARKPEAVRLRLAIRDVPSGKIGTIDLPLTPAIPAQASPPH